MFIYLLGNWVLTSSTSRERCGKRESKEKEKKGGEGDGGRKVHLLRHGNKTNLEDTVPSLQWDDP